MIIHETVSYSIPREHADVVLVWTGPGRYGDLDLKMPPRCRPGRLAVVGWVTATEAEAMLGVSRSTIMTAVRRGAITNVRWRSNGAILEIDAAELAAYWPPEEGNDGEIRRLQHGRRPRARR